MQALKEDEQAGGFRGSRPRRPRAIVLGPTRELTEQVRPPYTSWRRQLQLPTHLSYYMVGLSWSSKARVAGPIIGFLTRPPLPVLQKANLRDPPRRNRLGDYATIGRGMFCEDERQHSSSRRKVLETWHQQLHMNVNESAIAFCC